MFDTKFKKGKHYSTKTEFKKGLIPWNKGKSGYRLIKESLTKKEMFKDKRLKVWNKGLTSNEDNRIKKYWLGKKRPEIGKIISLKLKGRYVGKNNPFYGEKHTPQFIEKKKQQRSKQIFPLKDTSIEIKIQTFLNKLGITFLTHQYIQEIKHKYQCDILIPSINLIIECDGDYWHNYPIGKELDHIRTKELIEQGFSVLRLWECDIKKMTIKSFKEKLLASLDPLKCELEVL